MNNNKKLVIFCFLIAISTFAYKFFTYKKTINKERILTFGTASGYAPFVSIDFLGELEGFDIDVAQSLSTEMKRVSKIIDLGSMNSLFMALDQGKIDAIIWGLSITQDRLKKVAMVKYQGDKTDAYSMLFWKTIPTNIKSIKDMRGKKVGVEPASAQDSVLSKYDFINKVPTEKVDDALLNLQYGKIDAAFVEPAIAKKFKNKYPEIQILAVPLAQEDQVYGIGIAIKHDNLNLINEIQKAVKTLEKNGTIQALEKKWEIAQ